MFIKAGNERRTSTVITFPTARENYLRLLTYTVFIYFVCLLPFVFSQSYRWRKEAGIRCRRKLSLSPAALLLSVGFFFSQSLTLTRREAAPNTQQTLPVLRSPQAEPRCAGVKSRAARHGHTGSRRFKIKPHSAGASVSIQLGGEHQRGVSICNNMRVSEEMLAPLCAACLLLRCNVAKKSGVKWENRCKVKLLEATSAPSWSGSLIVELIRTLQEEAHQLGHVAHF